MPCEVARLMRNYDRDKNNKDKKDAYHRNFPQTLTVTTTANSSASLFASYRELARQQVLGARHALDLAIKAEKQDTYRKEFARLAASQAGYGLKLEGLESAE